jgi:hypothetical protein
VGSGTIDAKDHTYLLEEVDHTRRGKDRKDGHREVAAWTSRCTLSTICIDGGELQTCGCVLVVVGNSSDIQNWFFEGISQQR